MGNTFKVYLCAFQGGVVRNVETPDIQVGGSVEDQTNKILSTAYHYGQNEIQNVPGRCSVSVGDIIELPTPPSGGQWRPRTYRVDSVGFSSITQDEVDRLRVAAAATYVARRVDTDEAYVAAKELLDA